MLHADHTRKTQELARQRDAIAEHVRQAQDQGRTQYVQHVETLKNTVLARLEPELRNVDLEKLATEDPQEWARLTARGQQLSNLVQHLEQEQRRTAELQAREDHGRLQQRINESRAEVMAQDPEWSDQKYSQVLTTVSQRYGFSIDELSPVIARE